MKLNSLLLCMNPDQAYSIIEVNENNTILRHEKYGYRLPAPTTKYEVINIKPVYDVYAIPDLYIQIIVREILNNEE